ncbi:MAG: hypothetical protein NTU67_05005 [Gemmatimonadetes bacterium]|nr:hypothetical protein [Gemmatimonadota bacterium]
MTPRRRNVRWAPSAWGMAITLLYGTLMYGTLMYGAHPLAAQNRADENGVRLSSVARTAIDLYNAAPTTRANGAWDLARGTSTTGDVAVLNGPVTIAGTVRGSVVAINADVRLAPGATIAQQLIVIGGTITGQDSATIGGEIRVQAELLRYHLEGGTLVAESDVAHDDSWWSRRSIRHEFRRGEAYTDFFYVASRAYNRVEGWSFVAGPRFRRITDWGKINVEAFGVMRTADPVRWDNSTLGHDARVEAQFGKPWSVVLGAHAFDVVQPTESWQLSDGEVGLSSVLLHRDYRDYYVRHGGEGFIRLQGTDEADLTVAFSAEQWGNVAARNPWSLLRGSEPWRDNPLEAVGAIHLLSVRTRIDTREKQRSAWSGWYATVDWENGIGTLTSPQSACPVQTLALCTGGLTKPVNYTRGMVDLRRYNRISPHTFLNLRLVGGGWISGDALPLQKRMALGGPGTLPGFGFRETSLAPDVLNCSTGNTLFGTPGFCDRMALAQVELRSRLFSGIFRDDAGDEWWRPGLNREAQWVLFADAGRGWNVGTGNGGILVDKANLPALNSFKRDIGIGLDFGGLGFYWAKAVSDAAEPARFFMRLERRF